MERITEIWQPKRLTTTATTTKGARRVAATVSFNVDIFAQYCAIVLPRLM